MDGVKLEGKKVAFDTSTDIKYGTARIFHKNMAEEFNRKGVDAEFRTRNHKDTDILITKASDRQVRSVKKGYPEITVGLVHPSDHDRELVAEVEAADFLICNTYLEKDYYLRFNPDICVVHHAEYEPECTATPFESGDSTINIAYHGNKGHLQSFGEYLSPALERLDEFYDVQLVAVYNIEDHGKWKRGVPEIDVDHVQHARGADMSRIHQRLAECDIGLVPTLVDAPEWAKSVYRFLTDSVSTDTNPNDIVWRMKNTSNAGRAFVFWQLGIPVVASPAPELARVVEPGKNGLLAHTEEGWIDSLEYLIEHPNAAKSMGETGQQLVSTEYTMESAAEKLLTYIDSVERGETWSSSVLSKHPTPSRPPKYFHLLRKAINKIRRTM